MKSHDVPKPSRATPSPMQLRGYILRTTLLAILFLATIPRLAPAAPGSVDPTFDPGSGFAPVTDSLPVRVIFPLADGSFLLGGYFTNYNGVTRLGLAKVLEDGALDESFVPDP